MQDTPPPTSPLDAAARDSGAFAHLRDVNERLVLAVLRAQAEAEAASTALRNMADVANLDALTTLPNRPLLADRFDKAAATALRHGTRLAVLFVDLNGFKLVNDTLGHTAGDQVLRQAARVLEGAIRSADTVSRIGGDEFVLLLTDVSTGADALRTAEKLNAELAVPALLGEHVLRLSASVGISLFPDDAGDLPTLIELADAAMYRAKRRGFGSVASHGDQVVGELVLEPARLAALQAPVVRLSDASVESSRRFQELREANEQLVLAALTAQVLQEDAESARRRQSEFIAMLAHELRNPLAPMRNVSALLARVQPDDAMLPRLQGIIERQVVHMARLVDDLLDVSRAETGKLHLTLGEVDLDSVVAAAIDACRPSFDVRLQNFTAVLPGVPVLVTGDAMRLTQIVTNLLDNASKFTPESGDVALTLTVTHDEVEMTVRDSGIGIAAESLPTIFDLFSQDERAVGFNGSGLGIGLTVVRELVTSHGGNVVAHSDGIGLGSRFVVTMPRLVVAPAS